MNQKLWRYQNLINLTSYSNSTKIGNYITFLIPIFNFVKINLGGQLLIGETILLLFLPFLVIKRSGLNLHRNLFIIVVFLLLWFISQIVSDLVNQTVFRDYIRGWMAIVFFLSSILSLSLLLKTPLRIILFLSGLSVSFFIRPFTLFTDESFLILWKYGIGVSVLMILCLPYLWKLFKQPNNIYPLKYVIFIHFFIGTISLFLNSRSFAGITFLTGLLLIIFYKKKGKVIKSRHILVGLVTGVLLSIGIINIYTYGAQSGFLGKDAQEKFEMQLGKGQVDALSVLLAGRSEILVSTVAIADSPIIGHGSWAKDLKYLLLYKQLQAKFADKEANKVRSDELGIIPSHSYLFGAWVNSGLFGALFWLTLLYILIFKVLPQVFSQPSPISVIVMMTFINLLWDILFSPFGSTVRLTVAFLIVTYFILLKKGYYKTYE